jgi:hypothetical protein
MQNQNVNPTVQAVYTQTQVNGQYYQNQGYSQAQNTAQYYQNQGCPQAQNAAQYYQNAVYQQITVLGLESGSIKDEGRYTSHTTTGNLIG